MKFLLEIQDLELKTSDLHANVKINIFIIREYMKMIFFK